jgi:hypothetical protein
MNRLDFKGISETLQARLLASSPSVGIQARRGRSDNRIRQHHALASAISSFYSSR